MDAITINTTAEQDTTQELHNDLLTTLESLTDVQLAMVGGGQGVFTL